MSKRKHGIKSLGAFRIVGIEVSLKSGGELIVRLDSKSLMGALRGCMRKFSS